MVVWKMFKKVHFQKDMFVEGMAMVYCKLSKASQSMKDVYKNYKKYTLNAKKLGQKLNKSKFSLDAMTKSLGKILDKYVPDFPKEVKLKLPKLKKIEVANSAIKPPKN